MKYILTIFTTIWVSLLGIVIWDHFNNSLWVVLLIAAIPLIVLWIVKDTF